VVNIVMSVDPQPSGIIAALCMHPELSSFTLHFHGSLAQCVVQRNKAYLAYRCVLMSAERVTSRPKAIASKHVNSQAKASEGAAGVILAVG
jgi:hypothetical protein